MNSNSFDFSFHLFVLFYDFFVSFRLIISQIDFYYKNILNLNKSYTIGRIL
jgi:hypothetical protein